MAYDLGYWGISKETTWGTSLITGAGDTAYWLGLIGQGAGNHPWSEKTYQRAVPVPGAEYSGTLYRGTLTPRCTVTVGLLDAVPLFYGFGESTNGGAAPFTHALSFRDGTPMADPPSFTWHRELVDSKGVLTDDRMQTTGLRVETCRVVADMDQHNGILACVLGLVGKQHDDTVAFSLTTKPTSRISGASAFHLKHLTTKTLGGNDLAGLRGIELWWTRPITPVFTFTTTGGTNTSHLVHKHHFRDLIGPFLRLRIEAEDYEKIGVDDVDAAAPAKDLSLVFTRATNDTITLTGTNWHPSVVQDPIRHPTRVPPVVLEGPLEGLTCSVADSLDGAVHYV